MIISDINSNSNCDCHFIEVILIYCTMYLASRKLIPRIRSFYFKSTVDRKTLLLELPFFSIFGRCPSIPVQ